MEITRENYEIWAIDYLEGKLSTSESAVFMAFLGDNTDLADELDGMRDTNVMPIAFSKKIEFKHLKKEYSNIPITPDCFEEFCIAHHEGDLDVQSQKNLLEYIASNLERKQQFETYNRLKAEPNKQIVFKNKKALKIPTKKTAYINTKNSWLFTSSIAATIMFIILLNYNNKFHINSINTSVNTSQSFAIIKQNHSTISLDNSIDTSFNKRNVEANTVINRSNNNTQLHQNIKLSVIDTTNLEYPFIPAMRIEIDAIPTTSHKPSLILNSISNKDYFTETKQSFPRKTINTLLKRSQTIFTESGKLSIDAMLRRSVESINQVAETDLQYNSEVNDDGKIIAFALSSERFNITRKIKNN